MNSDRENLLTNDQREQDYIYPMRYSSVVTSRSIRKNLILLILSILIATSLTIYIYLNLAIEGNQVDQTKYKPLSRRKPILDHEAIFSDSGSSNIPLRDILAHCIVALRVAGQEVVRLSSVKNDEQNFVESKGKTLEGAEDVVTVADMKSNDMIVKILKDSYRRLSVVSEEDTTTAFESLRQEEDILPIKRSDFARMLRQNIEEMEDHHPERNTLIALDRTLVWIDPLDATMEFSENLTDYVTLMACVVHNSFPVAGVIHKPFLNQTFWSYRDEVTGYAKYSPDLTNLLEAQDGFGKRDKSNLDVIVSRSHAGDVRKILDGIYGDKINITAAGGSGFKTIELLAGRMDAYVHITRIKKWDICAPHAILNSISGGNLTDLGGEKIDFGDPKDKVVSHGLIATLNSTTHAGLVKSMKNLIVNR